MVEKNILAIDRSIHIEFILSFKKKNPSSGIKSNRQFRILLVEQLTKPLLVMSADPDYGLRLVG